MGDVSDGYAVVGTGYSWYDGKQGIIKLSSGKEVVKLGKYNYISLMEGYASVCKNDKNGLIKISTGKEVIKFGKYDVINDVSGDYAEVTKNGKSGIIRISTGKVVVKLGKYGYSMVGGINGDYAEFVDNSDDYRIINLTTGKVLWKYNIYNMEARFFNGISDGYTVIYTAHNLDQRPSVLNLETMEYSLDWEDYDYDSITKYSNGFALALYGDDIYVINVYGEVLDTF
jgi:hypothetical protein